ncbi:MAG: AtpZ/AtpI family protein [Phycisphaeraceae bacterium]|nr:AtpZ/AtpI family protein [Phycisphaeraceae bacterium]
MNPANRDQQKDSIRSMQGWGIAMNFAFAVAGMVLLGWALQTYLWPRSAPWLLLGFGLMGLVSGGYRFVREANAANRTGVRRGPRS